MGLTGPVIAYSGDLAAALDGDPIAALLACQIWFWTAGGTREACQTADGIEATLGITERRQKRAREVLVARGWLREQTIRKGGRTRLVWTMSAAAIAADVAALEARRATKRQSVEAERPDVSSSTDQQNVSRRVTKRQPTGIQNVSLQEPQDLFKEQSKKARAFSVAEIAAGACDSLTRLDLLGPPGEGIYRALDAAWRARWRPRDTISANKLNRQQWDRWLKAARPPSSIARILIGMGFDDWADRPARATWNYADRHAERWLRLYDRHVVQGVPAPQTAQQGPPGCHLWQGIWVPDGYHPDSLDADRVREGRQVFIIDDRKWADPSYDPSGRIAAQTAKYGPINQPTRHAP